MSSLCVPWSFSFRALDAARLGFVVLVSLGYASEVLFQPDIFANFKPASILAEMGSIASECLLVGIGMLVAVEWIDRRPTRYNAAYSLQVVGAVFAGASIGMALWVLCGGQTLSAETVPFLFGETLRLTALGAFLAVSHGLSRRLREAAARERHLALEAAAMQVDTDTAQLRLLEAQIEPHFLFNTIANLRRTWHIDPALGLRTHDNAMRYLEASLPRMRSPMSTLRDELDLTRAYLELFSLRMGQRLRFTIDVAPTLGDLPFPRMSLLTLVENSIRHGIAPALDGGSVSITAERLPHAVILRVTDDGVGFGAADTSGTGIGLPNIRSRLLAQYGRRARLDVESRDGGGVVASILIPTPEGPPA